MSTRLEARTNLSELEHLATHDKKLAGQDAPPPACKLPLLRSLSRPEFLSFSTLILILASLLGAVAFLSPFFGNPQQQTNNAMAHGSDALLMLTLLSLLALAAGRRQYVHRANVLKNAGDIGSTGSSGSGFALHARTGRFLSRVLPAHLGRLCFGPQFGFLAGLTTLLASSFFTGGVGPWLPYQMFAAGWVGAAAGLLPRSTTNSRRELWLLAGAGIVLGLLYGVVLNLWFWPYVFRPEQSALYWQPGVGLFETVKRYALFYLTTSFIWDAWRGIGNAALILLFGAPVLRLLRRYEQRFRFVKG